MKKEFRIQYSQFKFRNAEFKEMKFRYHYPVKKRRGDVTGYSGLADRNAQIPTKYRLEKSRRLADRDVVTGS